MSSIAGSDPKEVVRQGYDKISHAYRDDRGERNVGYRQRIDRFLLPRLDAPAKVLDLGCGNGIPTSRLLSEQYDVVGVDISETQIERAKALVPTATFLVGDMTSLEFPPESLDAIVSFYALIHVPVEEQRELVARIGKWLRPGGVCLLTTGVRAWTGLDDFYGTTMYWSYPDVATFKEWMNEADIEVLATEHIPEPPGDGHELVVGSRRFDSSTQ